MHCHLEACKESAKCTLLKCVLDFRVAPLNDWHVCFKFSPEISKPVIGFDIFPEILKLVMKYKWLFEFVVMYGMSLLCYSLARRHVTNQLQIIECVRLVLLKRTQNSFKLKCEISTFNIFDIVISENEIIWI